MLPLLAVVMPQDPQIPKDGAQFKGKVLRSVEMRYLISFPEGYETHRRERFPLILFLHGSGERGTDLNKVRRHGPPKEIAADRKLPFIVISPQCDPDGSWDADVLAALLDDAEKRYRIDRSREYLTGLSMGGYGTWALAIKQPRRFAAICVICGGGNPAEAGVLKDLPMWVVHGDADPSVPFAEDEAMVSAVQHAGGYVRFDIIKGGGHDVWTPIYAGDELYRWLLEHRRKP